MVSTVFHTGFAIFKERFVQLLIMYLITVVMLFAVLAPVGYLMVWDTFRSIQSSTTVNTAGTGMDSSTFDGVSNGDVPTTTTVDPAVASGVTEEEVGKIGASVMIKMFAFMMIAVALSGISVIALNRVALGYDESIGACIKSAIVQLPRYAVQMLMVGGILGAVSVGVVYVTSQMGAIVMLAALLGSMILMLPLSGLMMLVSVDASTSDCGWLPGKPFGIFKKNIGSISLVMLALMVVGGISSALSFLVIPPFLMALFYPCVAVALYANLGGTDDLEPLGDHIVLSDEELQGLSDEGSGSAGGEYPATAFGTAQQVTAQTQHAPAPMAQVQADPSAQSHVDPAAQVQPAHVVAPEPVSLVGVLKPGVAHGEWVSVPSDGLATLQLSWSDGPVPTLSLGTQQGEWQHFGEFPPPYQCVWTQVASGWLYVQLTPNGAVPQTFRLSITWPQPGVVAA